MPLFTPVVLWATNGGQEEEPSLLRCQISPAQIPTHVLQVLVSLTKFPVAHPQYVNVYTSSSVASLFPASLYCTFWYKICMLCIMINWMFAFQLVCVCVCVCVCTYRSNSGHLYSKRHWQQASKSSPSKGTLQYNTSELGTNAPLVKWQDKQIEY